MESTDQALDRALVPILQRYQNDPTCVVQILRELQAACSYLSPRAISEVAKALNLPRAHVEGVAGFYSFLHLEPAGEYRILFSDNITDRMLGNLSLVDRLCAKLWLERGRVSEDGLVSVDLTSCTGMCDQGPAMLVNNRAITRASPERIDHIAELVRARTPVEQWPAEYFEVVDNICRRDVLLDSPLKPGEALRAAVARG
ncbi:MAG TPA: NAD(P)H-dependent oxidoreductase subunit E, partial [Rhodocyclaceae bacterium]